jgi:hypothetical protein
MILTLKISKVDFAKVLYVPRDFGHAVGDRHETLIMSIAIIDERNLKSGKKYSFMVYGEVIQGG